MLRFSGFQYLISRVKQAVMFVSDGDHAGSFSARVVMLSRQMLGTSPCNLHVALMKLPSRFDRNDVYARRLALFGKDRVLLVVRAFRIAAFLGKLIGDCIHPASRIAFVLMFTCRNDRR